MRHGIAIMVALSLMIVSSQAADRWWDGANTGGTGDGASDGGTATWDTSTANWDQGSGIDRVTWTNANNDTAIFAGTAGTVSLGAGITIGGLQFDTASYVITNNTLTWGAAGSIVANQDATISSVMAGSVVVTKSGTGALTLSGSSTYTGGTIVNEGVVALNAGGGAGAVRGTLTINSNATVNLTIGDALGVTVGSQVSPVNIVTGTLNIALNANQGYNSDFHLTGGRMTSTGGGTYHFNARSLNSLAASTQAVISAGITIRTNPLTISNAVGATSDGVDMLISGSIQQLGGAYGVVKTGPGRLLFAATNTYSGETTINGGTLEIGGVGQLGSGSYAAVITNNGVLYVNSSAAQTLSGMVSGTGLLTKASSGTLTLSGTNTYSGATAVNEGKLIGNTGGSCRNSAVTVASGATLGARVATVNGQWVCSSLILNSGTTTTEFGFVVAPSISVAPILINGNFINNGTLTVAVTNGTFLAGLTYPLIKYTGSLTVGTLGAATLPAGVAGTLVNNTTNKSIDLSVTVGNGLVWSAGNGVWDINVSSNWNGQTAKYTDGLGVQFDDSPAGAGPFLVNISNQVSPGAMIVNNATKDYVFTNSAIAGSGVLIKSGAGMLTLSNRNTYTGGTIVNGGTLALGSGGNNACVRGTLTVNSGTIITSTAINALGIVNTVGTLNINGGNVDLSFGQHHIWGTTVNMVGGTLKFSSNTANEQFNAVYNISNSASQAQILAQPGGAMRMRDSVSAPCITFNVADGSQSVDLLVDAPITVGNGVGGLTKNGAGTMEFTKANTYPGPTVISGGTLLMNGSHSGSGISYTVTVAGALSGTGTISSAVSVDGVIAPGSGGIGKLTVGNVKWAAGPAWPFELGAASSGDRLAINGGFTNNGGSGFAFDLQNTGVAGVYTLVTWTASTTFTNTDFSANNVPAGLTPTFSMNANSLLLELTSGGGSPILGVSPAALDFGGVQVGSSSSLVFVVTNSGTAVLTGTAAVGGLPYAVAGGASYSVAAGGSSNVTISFTPSLAQAYPDAVTFLSDGGGSTNALAGYGYMIAGSTNASIALVGGQVAFGFNIASGALYHVQASTNLVDPVDNGFTNITGQLTNNGTATILFTNTSLESLQHFRVKSP